MTIDEKVDAFVEKLPSEFNGMLYIILYENINITPLLKEKIIKAKGADYARRITYTNDLPREEIRQLKSTHVYIFEEFYNYQGNGYN